MKKITSNKPFNRQCNVRRGAGPVYNKFCPPEFSVKTKSRSTNRLPDCSGEYDNIVQYVFEIETSGNHLAYVDCDYVE
jgi:hypothetical protein